MRAAKIAFAGATGRVLNYYSNIRNINITRTAAGQYTVSFLTDCDLDESKVIYPIINVTCQSTSGTATVVNVLNPTATHQSKNEIGFKYLISFKIETINIAVTLPSVLLTLLGFQLGTFVDRPVVMVDCQYTSLGDTYDDSHYVSNDHVKNGERKYFNHAPNGDASHWYSKNDHSPNISMKSDYFYK